MIFLFDIDTIISYEWKAWFIDKNEPSFPLFKISKFEYFLLYSGVYRKYNNLINYNGMKYYLSDNMYNTLKNSIKKKDISLSEIGVSIREFHKMDDSKININKDIFRELINKDISLYILNYYKISDDFKSKIESEFVKYGIKVDSWINYNKFGLSDDDEVEYKYKLISDLYEKSDDKEIIYCESNKRIFDLMCKQNIIKFNLDLRYYTSNKINPWLKKEINPNDIKKYESFVWMMKINKER